MKTLAAGIAACSVMAYAAYATAGTGADRTIEVVINHSAFDPAKIEVNEGETVTFVLINQDPIDHEFIIGDKASQRAHEFGTEAHHDERPTEISIPAGETVETTVDFDINGFLAVADPLLFGCHLPGHYDYGMRGVIQVNQPS